MTQAARRVDDCQFRLPLAKDSSEVYCALLAGISGIEDRSYCKVNEDACAACCRSFPPSERDPNPIVASHLHAIGKRVATLGGAPGCDLHRAQEIIELAVRNLPFDGDFPTPTAESTRPALATARSPCNLIPQPVHRSKTRVRRWAVGVTTAPRDVPTLSDCLPTLLQAGWDKPRLFVDGRMEVPDQFASLTRTDRTPIMGAWPNYYLSLAELLMREPEADAYMLVQDDVLFGNGMDVRSYLEEVLWPGPPGIASLYCSRGYTQPANGWYRMRETWRLGALAFIFCREAAQEFLADRDVVLHRWSRRKNGLADISWRVGQWAASADVPVYFTTPSLVQHAGDVSTVWPTARSFGNRRASRFVGDPDESRLL